ncbi:UDP-N-acetylglucosamine 2-epimerase [Salibacterium lacus]|uniref:UDP-N-acetylglucosamine 2-epimerase n=1 Tax=Salibacterium lacus TaxID=1898109 RepID=A0ABW5T2A1_9BACI
MKISVVTGTRAEYGLLYGLMKKLQNDDSIEFQLIVTGMHLSPEFGLTYQTIEEDGFTITKKVEILLSSDTPAGISKSIGLGVIGFSDAYEELQPDLIIVLGDRYEILAAVQAALPANIPVAHIHGGELTEGLIDDPIRHSITKMAHLHFVTAERYRQRVIQLGEQPSTVINAGAPGVDNIKQISLMNRNELMESLDLNFQGTLYLVTYHPETLNREQAKIGIENIMHVVEHFSDAAFIFTKSNADTEGRMINETIKGYADQYPHRVKLYDSLGQLRYLSVIQYVDAVIGNSSSGILEVPYFRKPTIDIGDRQKGRIKPESVISCANDSEAIIRAVKQAGTDEFQKKLHTVQSPYGNGNAANIIFDTIKKADLQKLIPKPFFDWRWKH